MKQEITIEDLFVILKDRLLQVHNLKVAYIGKMSVSSFDDFNEEDYYPSRIPIALGDYSLVKNCQKSLIEHFKITSQSFSVLLPPNDDSEGNLLYVVLEIDTHDDYSIHDLNDDDLFDTPFSLIN